MDYQTSSSERILSGLKRLVAELKYLKMARERLENQIEKAKSHLLKLSNRKTICGKEKVTIRDILLDNKYGTKEDVENDAWDRKMTSLKDRWLELTSNYYRTQVVKKYGTKKDVENDDWDDKKTSKLQFKTTGCNLNKEDVENDAWDGKMTSQVQDKYLELISNYYRTQEYEDRKGLVMVKKYGTKKDVENDHWDGKKTSKLQFKTTGSNLNKYEEPFSQDKRKETVQRVISCLIATIVFLWFTFDTYNRSSITPVQRLHKQHSPVFIWSSLLEPFCFMVLVWAIATSIVVGASFSRMQSSMLMFWAILMVIKSAKSITEVYVPILGIIFTGCYMLVIKQPELPNECHYG